MQVTDTDESGYRTASFSTGPKSGSVRRIKDTTPNQMGGNVEALSSPRMPKGTDGLRDSKKIIGDYRAALRDASNLNDLSAMRRGRLALGAMPEMNQAVSSFENRNEGLRNRIAGSDRGISGFKKDEPTIFSKLFGDF